MTPLAREQLDKLDRERTPGTWRVLSGRIGNDRIGADVFDIRGDEPTPIVSWQGFDTSDRSKAKHKANARLLAAAPALLAAARRGMELEDVLLGIASKGCRSAAALKIESCRAVSPDDSGAWCASCIAAKAIGYAP
jgi:hypothetical protein